MMQLSNLYSPNWRSGSFSHTSDPIFTEALHFGLELEIENSPWCEHQWDRWTYVEDGSLRYDGLELLSRRPVSGVDLRRSIEDLPAIFQEMHDEHGRAPSISHRCSLHCHINFRDKTVQDVVSFLVGFALYECILYSASGKDRYYNMYTPGLSNCYSQIRNARELYSALKRESATGVDRSIRCWEKYTCVNLKRLPDLGTVEVRSHSGTLDEQEILRWVNMLYDLVIYTRNKTPEEIIDEASPTKHLEVFSTCPDEYNYFENNYMNAVDIVAI